MSRFLCRLSLKMITDWKKEILLVILGIIISSCAVIKFTDNITNFNHYYYDTKGTREERIFHENRIHFTFHDSDKLDLAVEVLKKQKGIQNVILKGNFEIVPDHDFAVAAYSSIPVLTEHDNSIATPEQVEDGTIVLSYESLRNVEGNTPSDPEDGIVITYGEVPEKTDYTVFYSCGQPFYMGNKSYRIVAENFNFEENLLSQHDFLELDKTEKLTGIELIYIYDDGFSESQMTQVEELLHTVKSWEDTYKELPNNTLSVSDYLDLMSNLIIGVALAVLNALFIYQTVLKRRIPSYSVLKLLGVRNLRLQAMILLEMTVLFGLSFIVSVMLFLLYCTITGELIYNLRYSVGYSFILLLAIYVLLSVLMTIKLFKKQPFENLADNRDKGTDIALFHRKIWIREYFASIKNNIFIIIQICLAMFLINNQVGYIASESERLNSISAADNNTYLYQYAMAAAGLFDIENGDYARACEQIQSLPGIENIGELFDTSISIEGESEKYPDDWFQINAMDSIVTSAITYNIKEGRWLTENDRNDQTIHAVLGGRIANRHKIGDTIKIDLDTGKTYEIKVVGKLADYCNILNLHVLMAGQDMNSFMRQSDNDIFVNQSKLFEEIKADGLGYSNAHCIVKLNKNADKKMLSNYGKLVSFEEMKQETKTELYDFIKEAAIEGTVWIIVIIFGIIATSYLIGKNRRYVWGIYLMLGVKPQKLLKVHMINSGITYIIAAVAALIIYQINLAKDGMSYSSDISSSHIIFSTAFFLIMMAVSLMSNLYILKMEPKEILTQTKE